MGSGEERPLTIGVALRRGRQCPAICVVEAEQRSGKSGPVDHFLVRHLERLSPHTTYVAIAERAGEIAAATRERAGDNLLLYVDATGCGEPIVDLFREDPRIEGTTACYFNHGDQRGVDSGRVQIGKAFLVASLQAQLQAFRLYLPRTVESERLATELEFEVKVDPNANHLVGAFPVGSCDELVTALGLAVAGAPPCFATQLIY
jgi:hypothetical protein